MLAAASGGAFLVSIHRWEDVGMTLEEEGMVSIPEPVEGGTESTESLGFLDYLTGSRAALVRAQDEVAALAHRPAQQTELRRLRDALERIAVEPCDLMARPNPRADDRPCPEDGLSEELWCASCIARKVLGEDGTE